MLVGMLREAEAVMEARHAVRQARGFQSPRRTDITSSS